METAGLADALDGVIAHFALDQPHLRHLQSPLQGPRCEIIGQWNHVIEKFGLTSLVRIVCNFIFYFFVGMCPRSD